MHRQSLGSPALKLHTHAVLFSGDGVINDDIDNTYLSEDLQSHRKDKLASSSSAAADHEERKSPKPYQQKHSLIHLIPLLTFFCFLVLYLSSHDPSRKDLAQFSGFTTVSSKKIVTDSFHMDDNVGGGFLDIEKSDALAIRSTRSLQQQQRHRLHRKFSQ